MKFILVILLFVSGCMSGPKIISSKKDKALMMDQPSSISFESVDINEDGIIQKEEYYEQVGEVNSKDPIIGLIFILGSVVICATISSFVMRPKKTGVK